MTSKTNVSVWVAMIVVGLIAIGAYWYPSVQKSVNNLGTAVDCGSTTCFTTLGVLTSFQVDGTSIFNGSVTQSGNLSVTGNLAVSGTSALTGTTTEAAGFIMTKAPSCFEFYATSTATKVKMTFAATTSAVTTATGIIPVVAYGTCN